MRIQPVILTTPARRDERVDTIAAAFIGHPGFADPIVHVDAAREGAARATWKALREAAAGGGHVLFLEDDLIVDPEAADRVAAADFPDDVAVISFCDMREVPEFALAGLYPRSALGSDGLGWWGNQALLLHRDTAAMVAALDWFADEIERSRGLEVHRVTYEDDGRNCSDIRLALLIDTHGAARRSYAVSVPSVFRHVGYESVCFPGRGMGERETRNWIGDRRRFGLLDVLGG